MEVCEKTVVVNNGRCNCNTSRVLIEWSFPISKSLKTLPVVSEHFSTTNENEDVKANFFLRVKTLRGGIIKLSVNHLNESLIYGKTTFIVTDNIEREPLRKTCCDLVVFGKSCFAYICFRPKNRVSAMKAVIILTVGDKPLQQCRWFDIVPSIDFNDDTRNDTTSKIHLHEGGDENKDVLCSESQRRSVIVFHYMVDDLSAFLSCLAHGNVTLEVKYSLATVNDFIRVINGTFTRFNCCSNEFSNFCHSFGLDVVADAVTIHSENLLFVACGRVIRLFENINANANREKS